MKKILFGLFLLLPFFAVTQNLDQEIDQTIQNIEELKTNQLQLEDQLENLRLQRIIRDLKKVGLPSTNYIEHEAMILEYAEEHEQAKWVAHIILPQIIEGTAARSNDFRVDPLVKTGTAVEEDYFLKYKQVDGSYEYDGFGYDRGHLAPSADFRWSEKALSESYFYSNMSPQRPEFNREGWAELEGALRAYIFRNPESQLYVVTGPILEAGLPVIERSINKPSIPEAFFKVALDLDKQLAIGFIIPNQEVAYPLQSYAAPVDEIEQKTGLDFFNQVEETLENQLEARVDIQAWFPEEAFGDVRPIYAPSLPRNHFNTVQAKQYIGINKDIHVCGTVVSTRYARSGNLWINLDKKFPNQIFSVYIPKEELVNFSYQPDQLLENQKVCFEGKVMDMSGTPTMKVYKEEDIELMK